MTSTVHYLQPELEQMTPPQIRAAATHCLEQPNGNISEALLLIPPHWFVEVLTELPHSNPNYEILVLHINTSHPYLSYDQVAREFDRANDLHRDTVNTILAGQHLAQPPKNEREYYSLICAGQCAMLREIHLYPNRTHLQIIPQLGAVLHTINDQALTRNLTTKMFRNYVRFIYDTFIDITNADIDHAMFSLSEAEAIAYPRSSTQAAARRRSQLSYILQATRPLLTRLSELMKPTAV